MIEADELRLIYRIVKNHLGIHLGVVDKSLLRQYLDSESQKGFIGEAELLYDTYIFLDSMGYSSVRYDQIRKDDEKKK